MRGKIQSQPYFNLIISKSAESSLSEKCLLTTRLVKKHCSFFVSWISHHHTLDNNIFFESDILSSWKVPRLFNRIEIFDDTEKFNFTFFFQNFSLRTLWFIAVLFLFLGKGITNTWLKGKVR